MGGLVQVTEGLDGRILTQTTPIPGDLSSIWLNTAEVFEELYRYMNPYTNPFTSPFLVPKRDFDEHRRLKPSEYADINRDLHEGVIARIGDNAHFVNGQRLRAADMNFPVVPACIDALVDRDDNFAHSDKAVKDAELLKRMKELSYFGDKKLLHGVAWNLVEQFYLTPLHQRGEMVSETSFLKPTFPNDTVGFKFMETTPETEGQRNYADPRTFLTRAAKGEKPSTIIKTSIFPTYQAQEPREIGDIYDGVSEPLTDYRSMPSFKDLELGKAKFILNTGGTITHEINNLFRLLKLSGINERHLEGMDIGGLIGPMATTIALARYNPGPCIFVDYTLRQKRPVYRGDILGVEVETTARLEKDMFRNQDMVSFAIKAYNQLGHDVFKVDGTVMGDLWRGNLGPQYKALH